MESHAEAREIIKSQQQLVVDLPSG